MGPILCVDPGDVRLGLAISDPSGCVARPLQVLRHVSRQKDAQAILDVAQEQGATKILVGLALDDDGQVGPQARKALRMVDALGSLSSLPIDVWDESGSTKAALRRGRRDPLLDARAAAFVLQEYLDAQTR